MFRRLSAVSLLVAFAACALHTARGIGKTHAMDAAAPRYAGETAAAPSPGEVLGPPPTMRPPPESVARPLARPLVASATAVAAAGQATPSGALPQWSHSVACQTAPNGEAGRERLRTTFTRVAAPPGNASLYFDPSVPDFAVSRLLYALTKIEALVSARLGLGSSAPDVYLYRNPAQLREGVCVSPKSVSYYDGAIHLALDPEDDLLKSLKHEYAHHALFSHGIRRPVWFQEGVAMLMGDESQWSRWRPKGPLLQPAQMVQTFPQAASAEAAEAFYGQAFAMTTFLSKLCENGPACELRDLVRALSSGAVHPEDLFDWAVSQRGPDLVRTARLPLWDDYAANGMQFGTDTAAAISARR